MRIPSGGDAAPDRVAGHTRAREFVVLCAAFRATGGMARGDELAGWLEDRRRGDFISLARLIASREVFSLEWHGTHWVPLFQLNRVDLSLRAGPRLAIAELPDGLDGWAIAGWFARRNPWLRGSRPVDQLDSDLWAVLQAARADRFAANG